jgi:hypothetical protein
MDEDSMKIIVCGDSFCSSHNYERDHFSQILEDEYGYTVINLAQGGTGTVAICFQIKEAIQLQADVIVHGQTDPGRIEIPVNNKSFIPALGLQNFVYPFKDESSYNSPYVGGIDAPFFSSLLGSLTDDPEEIELMDPYLKISREQRQAVKMYINFLYDRKFKTETDNWLYEYWQIKILQNKIISIPFLRQNFAKIAYDFANKTNHQYPKCYHTDRDTQQELAKCIYQEIQTKLKIA